MQSSLFPRQVDLASVHTGQNPYDMSKVRIHLILGQALGLNIQMQACDTTFQDALCESERFAGRFLLADIFCNRLSYYPL